MSILTEAKVRKLLKEAELVENSTFSLNADDKLTPAARSFLNDRHVKIVNANKPAFSTLSQKTNHIDSHDDEQNVIDQICSELMTLYPSILTAQKVCYQNFKQKQFKHLHNVLSIIQCLVSGQIKEDIIEYDTITVTNAELLTVRLNEQIGSHVLLDYTATDSALACYTVYIDCMVLRKRFEIYALQTKPIVNRLITLLKSIEVLLWLIVKDEEMYQFDN